MSAPFVALVTGSSGFVGSHLARQLVDAGCSVCGLDLAPPTAVIPPEVRQVGVDIRDGEAVRATLNDARPEVVFHLAGQPSPSQSMRDPIADIEVNVLGTVNVARAAASAGVRRLVFFSTAGSMYGEPERIPVDDDTVPAPHVVYGVSKLAAEHYLRVLAADAGLEVSVLRPGHVYGPDARAGPDGRYEEAVANFAFCMLRDEPVTIAGDGSQRLDYVYVEDVVDAAVRAAFGEPATCVIGSGNAPQTLEVFDLVAGLTAYTSRPVFVDPATDVQQLRRYVLDATRARRVWGWEPRVSLEEGIAVTVDWFRGRLGTN